MAAASVRPFFGARFRYVPSIPSPAVNVIIYKDILLVNKDTFSYF